MHKMEWDGCHVSAFHLMIQVDTRVAKSKRTISLEFVKFPEKKILEIKIWKIPKKFLKK